VKKPIRRICKEIISLPPQADNCKVTKSRDCSDDGCDAFPVAKAQGKLIAKTPEEPLCIGADLITGVSCERQEQDVVQSLHSMLFPELR
jgi:hypothetical protein